LKGGDPFVLGRGGEEALALRNAGVLFDVVPGITSAVAAPALAGIPVTHRGVASGFLVVSGHDAQTFADAIGSIQPNGITLVVLMGGALRASWASMLVERGWKPQTPAALVTDASLPDQQVWRGTLVDLAAGAAAVESDGPTTCVVGEVAALDLFGAEATAGETSSRTAARYGESGARDTGEASASGVAGSRG
jgi:uroporphyrin-III C-methyltransferase/precorrin-2 dehydrogenase/sirohydrochlorin ferrochelatase